MGLTCKLGLSCNGKPLCDELFRAYAENGIAAMEIALATEEYEMLDYAELRRLADKYGIDLWSLHLPFLPFDVIDVSKPELCDYTVALFKTYIKRASEAGIRVFVIHPSGEPLTPEERAERIACSQKSLKELAEYAATLGCRIAVEDLPRTCLGHNAEELLALTSVHENLYICFDTNHLLKEDIVEFVHRVGKKIITLHVSDFDYMNERHWLPGEGKIDWAALTAALEEVGYDGYWLYEIGFGIPWSIERDRHLTCADFKRNYDEIMAGKRPTPIGRPKENIGMWKNSPPRIPPK